MMKLQALQWNSLLQQGAEAYMSLDEEQRQTDISDRLAEIGIDREILTTDIIFKGTLNHSFLRE